VPATPNRQKQLAYSDIQSKMLLEHDRRKKAAKIVSVLTHFAGRTDLAGSSVLDLGCSTGFIAHELHLAGAHVVGVDIDEPGLERARQRFGSQIEFVVADGERLPFDDDSFDAIVFNQIYEHVLDPEAVMAEIRRVLRPEGAVYLGFGNRMAIMEPHHKLPFLSWLPYKAADRYVALTGRADGYHERFRTRRGLRQLVRGLRVWDYTYTVLTEPSRFHADDMVPSRLHSAPPALWKALTPIMPTFIWVGTPGTATPRGASAKLPPRPVNGIPPVSL
jgi:ubiquinone/menaquinone biosynthesis C-methylase UbiE